MSKINVNGVELEIDLFDADTAEKVEDELEQVRIRVEALQNKKGIKLSDAIREGCRAVFDCFDNTFGEGTAKKIFGGKTNLKQCLDCFGDMSKQLTNGPMKEINDLTVKYSPERLGNREARRHPAAAPYISPIASPLAK